LKRRLYGFVEPFDEDSNLRRLSRRCDRRHVDSVPWSELSVLVFGSVAAFALISGVVEVRVRVDLEWRVQMVLFGALTCHKLSRFVLVSRRPFEDRVVEPNGDTAYLRSRTRPTTLS
jgi:hypothetical protein